MPEDVFTDAGESFVTSQMVRDWLRKPFKPEQIGKLPATAKRPALDFIGHAAITDRLNKIAPDWHYTIDNMSTAGETVWIRGTMIIGGIARPEFGDGADPKSAIGNFIRRGAMRFGVGLDLWSREELEESAPVTTGDQGAAGPGEVVESSLSASPGHQASTEGEAVVEGTGGGSQTSPGATFPLQPSDCDHKTKTGRWLPARQLNGVPVCPRCGLSAVIYRESAA